MPAYLDDIVAKYGQFVEIGQKRFKTTFENSLKSLDEMLSSKEFIANAEVRYSRKGRKISMQVYIKKHTNRVRNIEKGSEAERIFQELFGGIKPNAIKTVHTNRFIDNIFDGISREIKSGNIKNSKAFQTQFQKDIDIVRRKLGSVKSVEWHILGEIDEKAIDWAIEYAKKYKLEKSVKFVLY